MRPTGVTPLDRLDPADAWAAWSPGDGEGEGDPWGLRWAGHLYRRAAFGANHAELAEAAASGPEAAVDGLLAGGPGRDEFDRLMDDLAPESPGMMGGEVGDGGLQGWWLHRMLRTAHPLRERMTLFWHNHFATSLLKVRQPALMKRQNLLFREHALGKFGPLLASVSRDPAMLIWLDSNSNVRGRPNENYARELMELFSLGVGRYTEADVREAARAFTGWHTNGRAFVFNRLQHDGGPKTVLGRTGDWDGGDVVRIVLERPETARFLVRKLYRQFVSEGAPPPDALLEPLAARYRDSDYDTADLVRTILRSRLFYSRHAFRKRIKSPVEYVVGMLRSLEAKPAASQAGGFATASPQSQVMEGLGQTLFAPPSVKGWPGGEDWLNSATLLARHNLAWKLLQGGPAGPGFKADPSALVRSHAAHRDAAGRVDFLLDLLLQPGAEGGDVDPSARRKLADYFAGGGGSDDRLRETTHAILLMPEYQLS